MRKQPGRRLDDSELHGNDRNPLTGSGGSGARKDTCNNSFSDHASFLLSSRKAEKAAWRRDGTSAKRDNDSGPHRNSRRTTDLRRVVSTWLGKLI